MPIKNGLKEQGKKKVGLTKNRTRRTLKKPEEIFGEDSLKTQWIYTLKCLFTDYLLDYPRDAWHPISKQEIKNHASGLILHMLDKTNQNYFFQTLPKKEQVYILDILRNQAIDFVEHNKEDIFKYILI